MQKVAFEISDNLIQASSSYAGPSVSDKHKKHLTEVFKIFIYTTITQLFLHTHLYTHLYTLIHTFILLIYTFDVSYIITLFFLLFLYQLYINQSVTH